MEKNEKNFTNENIIHVKDGKVEYLKFRILEKYNDKLKCCFTALCQF